MAGILTLGLLGCGNFGRGLAAGFRATPRVRLVACADARPEAASACAAALGITALSPEALLASDVAAVAVATPNATHRALVEAALAGGKHVWCEKPMALRVEDCDAMLAAAAAAGRRLTVGHMQRHFPLLAAVAAAVAGGVIGAPALVTLCRREHLQRAPGWLRQAAIVGGLPFQSSVHEFDWLRSAFGEVTGVCARGVAAPLQPGLDYPDGLVVALEFASGCVGELTACMTDFVGAYRGECNGAEGSLHFDLLAGSYRLAGPGGVPRDIAVPEGTLRQAYGPAGARARADFVAWVLDGQPPAVTGVDGRQAVAIACAVRDSLRTGVPAPVAARAH